MSHHAPIQVSVLPDKRSALWWQALDELELESQPQRRASLKRLNTFRIGGHTECLIDVVSRRDLQRLLPLLENEQVPWMLLGKGSNLLFPDEDWPGVVMRLSRDFKYCQIDAATGMVRAGAALSDVALAQKCAAQGLSGLEWMIGVPGNVGGAVAMNAGAHGGEVGQVIQEVEYMDLQGQMHRVQAKDLDFAYRLSPLRAPLGKIVTEAHFQLTPSTREAVSARNQQCLNFREQKQPRNQPNCGSVFKNPPGEYAGRLIEAAGLKGHRIGQAQISPLHANFIVNLGEATSSQVMALIQLAQSEVLSRFGHHLELEVQRIQFDAKG